MTTIQPLAPTALYQHCEPTQFSFTTTADLHDNDTIIGQPRAVDAIQFGIGIQHQGYNLFALGPNGIGKYTAVHKFLSQKAPTGATPPDWCYVNNFAEPHKPRALQLPAGQGVTLRDDVQELIEGLFTIIPAALTSEAYETQKARNFHRIERARS